MHAGYDCAQLMIHENVSHVYSGTIVCSPVNSPHTVEHCLIFLEDIASASGTLYDCSFK